MEFFGPTYDVSGLTNRSLIDYADHRRLHKGRVAGRLVTSGTIHRELRTLREALKDAIAENRWEGTIPDMPDLGDVYKPRETVIDQPQSQRVLLALAPQWRDHFVLYRQLGLDRGELYRIAPGDIDWKRNELRVRGTKTEARDRVLPMPPEVAAILRARHRQSPMFENWHNALRDLAKACQKAGVPRCNFKDLRRSFATDLAKAGVSPLFLKDLMGHTTTRMLEQVYARVGKGAHMHEAMRNVASLRGCANSVPETALKAIGAESVGGPKDLKTAPNSTEKPKSGG
jgi:integrase